MLETAYLLPNTAIRVIGRDSIKCFQHLKWPISDRREAELANNVRANEEIHRKIQTCALSELIQLQ